MSITSSIINLTKTPKTIFYYRYSSIYRRQYSSYERAPSNGLAWTRDCDKRELFFGMIVFADYIIHRGGNYGSSGEWSRIFIRGHTGKSNASSLGEGFRLALDMSEDKSIEESEKLVGNTEAFFKELFITQEKFRKRNHNLQKTL